MPIPQSGIPQEVPVLYGLLQNNVQFFLTLYYLSHRALSLLTHRALPPLRAQVSQELSRHQIERT